MKFVALTTTTTTAALTITTSSSSAGHHPPWPTPLTPHPVWRANSTADALQIERNCIACTVDCYQFLRTMQPAEWAQLLLRRCLESLCDPMCKVETSTALETMTPGADDTAPETATTPGAPAPTLAGDCPDCSEVVTCVAPYKKCPAPKCPQL